MAKQCKHKPCHSKVDKFALHSLILEAQRVSRKLNLSTNTAVPRFRVKQTLSDTGTRSRCAARIAIPVQLSVFGASRRSGRFVTRAPKPNPKRSRNRPKKDSPRTRRVNARRVQKRGLLKPKRSPRASARCFGDRLSDTLLTPLNE